MEMSIRYHPLSSTRPDIIDSMLLLTGRIDRSSIETAGLANRKTETEPLGRELDRCLRYALEVDSAIKRGYRWSAVELLHYTRKSMMELFTRSHHGQRPYQFFQQEAELPLQEQLGRTLPLFDLKSARACLARFLDILADDLDALTGGQVQLNQAQAEILSRVHSRQLEDS
jgi:hypothetical protein